MTDGQPDPPSMELASATDSNTDNLALYRFQLRRAAAVYRARRLAARCEGARTPILRALVESPVVADMTSREREIAELAARGLSNQEISERLTLSIRTVGNHLTRLYGKLGIRRDDLPGLFDLD